MKPIDQTRFGKWKGNCYQACLASILELTLDLVPDFCNEHGADWFDEARKWLRRHHCYDLLLVQCDGRFIPPAGYYIVSGDGPRGLKHSVIHRDGQMVHDPYPSKAGLVKADVYEFFITLDPSRTPI